MKRADHQPPLRVGLVQVRPRKAEVDANLEKVRTRVAEAAPEHDLLVFPEACLSGYFLEGGVVEAALTARELADRLGPPPEDAPDVALGFYERWRRRIYNSVAYLTPGTGGWDVVHVHRKMFLPTYGIFDEARFVETGRELRAFDTRFGRVGLLICEEIWHSLPPTVLALDGAELLVVVSASPARDYRPEGGAPGNLERWERLAPSAAVEHGVFVVVSQLVGTEGGKVFPGGSLAAAPDGELLVQGPFLEEGVTTALLDGTQIERARFDAPLLADLEQMLPHLRRAMDRAVEPGAGETGGSGRVQAADPSLRGGDPEAGGAGEGVPLLPGDASVLDLDLELVERTLVHFIREEVVERRGFEKVVLGLSGGVDSSVSAFLAARALGPEKVHAFLMPHEVSSPESREHAERVVEELGIESRVVEITDPVRAYVEAFEPDISDTRKGNLMARMRSVVLFDQSAKLHALPLGTGNKSERLLGYYTWHADDSPPINPLGDLFKTQVWALARHLGVPEEIVEKPASADLVKGVHDEDEIGIGYREADPILYWLVKGYLPGDLVHHGFDADAVDVVWRRLSGTHWKRELPTVAVLSSSAIGEFYLRPVDF